MTDFHLADRWMTPCYEKLSDLHWIDGFTVRCMGVKIGIRTNDAPLLQSLRERLIGDRYKPVASSNDHIVDVVFSLLKGGRAEGSRVRNFNLAYLNHTVVGRSHRMEEVLERFESYVTLAVAQLAQKHVFVHSGVVEWQGKAILIPGKTLSGKTTLVQSLVKAGATYYSDDYAILDGEGMVLPYARPLSVRMDPVSPQIEMDVVDFGGRIGERPVPVALVVTTQYSDDANWRPRRVSKGKGILSLLENCPAAQTSPQLVIDYLQHATSDCEFITSKRGDADAVATDILHRASSLLPA